MDIRYSCNQKDFKRYTTEEMRDEMLITGLYKADEVVAVYSHVDRMVTLGCMPVHETVSIDKGIDIWANFGTHYFLERREIGMFNIGKDSTGIVVADGVKYELGYKDCLYITKGTKEVTFASADPEHPAKFYMVSAPAHCSYETRLIKMADANHRPLGSVETCNKRTINQFIHPDVLKTCQLSMGMTELEPGSNWNTKTIKNFIIKSTRITRYIDSYCSASISKTSYGCSCSCNHINCVKWHYNMSCCRDRTACSGIIHLEIICTWLTDMEYVWQSCILNHIWIPCRYCLVYKWPSSPSSRYSNCFVIGTSDGSSLRNRLCWQWIYSYGISCYTTMCIFYRYSNRLWGSRSHNIKCIRGKINYPIDAVEVSWCSSNRSNGYHSSVKCIICRAFVNRTTY